MVCQDRLWTDSRQNKVGNKQEAVALQTLCFAPCAFPVWLHHPFPTLSRLQLVMLYLCPVGSTSSIQMSSYLLRPIIV
jgi:hypothetical protein